MKRKNKVLNRIRQSLSWLSLTTPSSFIIIIITIITNQDQPSDLLYILLGPSPLFALSTLFHSLKKYELLFIDSD